MTLVLHLAVPVADSEGYACDSEGKPLKYRLNGIYVLIIMTAGYVFYATIGYATGSPEPGSQYTFARGRVPLLSDHFTGLAQASNQLGIILSLLLFWRSAASDRDQRRRCKTVDNASPPPPSAAEVADYASRGLWMRFYCGETRLSHEPAIE
jgi:hypothetical protein